MKFHELLIAIWGSVLAMFVLLSFALNNGGYCAVPREDGTRVCIVTEVRR